ncbi:MAG: hypothetical protein A2X28_00450 [Elusimicrobia bacterium GWA2_56_46]|nr:MAG: hypothetical protein A2X28_00450 [Elusimicrobia bacterium GWA2_56_46]OGR55838.1 MAG: hypothetical protein A2X39_05825 [Elusimicrobia bacterium GWC2_56_31]HBB65818.1 hypothetical protein [Elusimicrobiota bacterium]HBW22230.1 hypothetical protein [Elusimicrobiota bacterium]
MRDLTDLMAGSELFVRPEGKDLKAEEAEKMLSPLGFFTARLDGAVIKNKQDLLAALAAGFRFPSYFGYNWDALLDCLRSLPDNLRARGYAVVIDGSALFLKDSPADLADFREISAAAAEFILDKYKLPFKVIML